MEKEIHDVNEHCFFDLTIIASVNHAAQSPGAAPPVVLGLTLVFKFARTAVVFMLTEFKKTNVKGQKICFKQP